MPIRHVEKEKSEGKTKLTVVETGREEAWADDAKFTYVGERHARVEGAEKVTGRARYSYDIRLTGQLYARVLRSPHPHAKITRIDTSKAEALPGVRAVLTYKNAPDIEWYEESKLFDQTVRFAGDEVAAVAADSEEIAEDAIRLIEVEYETKPFVLDIETALAPGAPALYKKGNIAGEAQKYKRGAPAAAFKDADVVIEREFTTQTAVHNSLEPHGCTAVWEGEQLTIYSSTQGVWAVRADVAEKMELPEHHVRVIKQYMGGGFGAKQIAWKQDVIAALLAQAAGKPVQLMLDRVGENLAVGNRNATRQHVRIGAKKNGTLTAIEARVELQTGAYQVGGEASDVAGIYQTLYRCENVTTEQIGVYTNTGPAVAFRAPGYVEGAFALESAMDELARELGMDPVELRMQNYSTQDQKKEQPYTSPDALRLCIERAAEEFGWGKGAKKTTDGTKRRGVGFAAHDWIGGGGKAPGYAWVKLNTDGTADVVTGTQDIGTGTRVALAQVAAEELCIPLECVAVHMGDTANGPYSPASAGSSTLSTIGPAVRAAAIEAKRQLLEAAAPILEEEPAKLTIRDGKVVVADDPKSSVSIKEVCGRIAPHMIQGQGARGPEPKSKTPHTFGAQFAEVEVDTETGEVTVLRIVATHDAGRIVNPTMVDSQIIGGVTQGVGFALTEERVVDAATGIVLNANLEEYKVPTVLDIPAITHAALSMPDSAANTIGAKGIGEPPLVPTAPAIANAIFDAVGVRLRETPLTRRHLLAALAEAKGE